MKVVFLDRDGVINENRPDHVKSWAEFRFIPGAPEAVARLSDLGSRVFIITNQAVINQGIVPQATIDEINSRMVNELERRGARIEAVAYCPHRPEDHCECRKPRPGLLLDLARQHDLDLRESAVVGDALTDIEAGQAAGCRTVLVLTGRGREQLVLAKATGRGGFMLAADLSTAVAMLHQSAFTAAPPWHDDIHRIMGRRRVAEDREESQSSVDLLAGGRSV